MTYPLDDASALRALPALTGSAPDLGMEDIAEEPLAMFHLWMGEAVDAGVPEPHAMTLSTVDDAGFPDARTLILKGVDDRGWAFAGLRSSCKGTQLTARPVAALNFWWQPLVRAVRLRGRVIEASASDASADLAARSATARADVSPGDWALWRLSPVRVEFWQGEPDRRHTRIVFERGDDEQWRRRISGRLRDGARREGR